MRLTRSQRNQQRVRPVPLLDSSSDDEPLVEQLRNRITYMELLDKLPDIKYHTQIAVFVALVQGSYIFQIFLPLLLLTRIRCEWGSTFSESTVILVSFPLLGFITPLIDAILAKVPLRYKLMLSFVMCTVFLGIGFLCKSLTQLAITRMIAGAFVIPESVLTKMWAQVIPLCRQQDSIKIIGVGKALGLVGSTGLILITLTLEVKWVLLLSAIPMVVLSILAFFVKESPLMLIDRGKYSSIMQSLESMYGKHPLGSIKLADVDFSEVSLRLADNMAYIHSSKSNTRNVFFVFLIEFLYGIVLTMMLAVFSLLFTNNYCTIVTNNTTKCLETHYSTGSSKMINNTVNTNDYIGILVATAGSVIGIVANFVPSKFLSLKIQQFLGNTIMSVGFAASCFCFGKTFLIFSMFLVLCGNLVMLNIKSQLKSSLSMAIFTKSSVLMIHAVGTIIGKELVDYTVTISLLLPLLLCTVLTICLSILSLCYIIELPTTESIPSEVEMEDPLEMELDD